MVHEEIDRALSSVSTATVSTVLFKLGVRNVWIRGARALTSGQPRIVGRAFTLRFIPAREDLSNPEAWSSPQSTRAAVEAMPEDCIAVVDAMGLADAGVFGDILCARMRYRRVRGLVTDGAVRDIMGVQSTGLPVWCSGVAAPPAVVQLTAVGWEHPIGCGGVAVFPGDYIVADQDGVIVVPSALVGEVIEAAIEQERQEDWILREVKSGAPLAGLYPINDTNRFRYEAFKNGQEQPTEVS